MLSTRLICVALLVSSAAAFAQTQPRVRPHQRVFISGPHFRSHARFHHHYYQHFDPFRYFVQDFAPPAPPSDLIVPYAPAYYFISNQSTTHPRLVFKDHMTYTVEDYWKVDDQLHFITSENGATRTVPFADLDVQATTDLLEKQGFKFRVRDEPIERWLKHHSPEKPAKRPKAKD